MRPHPPRMEVQPAVAHLDQPDVFQVLVQAAMGALRLLDGQVGEVFLVTLVRVVILAIGALVIAVARSRPSLARC
jgi:hypothetical protein